LIHEGGRRSGNDLLDDLLESNEGVNPRTIERLSSTGNSAQPPSKNWEISEICSINIAFAVGIRECSETDFKLPLLFSLRVHNLRLNTFVLILDFSMGTSTSAFWNCGEENGLSKFYMLRLSPDYRHLFMALVQCLYCPGSYKYRIIHSSALTLDDLHQIMWDSIRVSIYPGLAVVVDEAFRSFQQRALRCQFLYNSRPADVSMIECKENHIAMENVAAKLNLSILFTPPDQLSEFMLTELHGRRCLVWVINVPFSV